MISQRLKPFFYLGMLYLVLSLILRLVFIFHPITTSSFSVWEATQIVLIGVVNDFLVFVLASSIFVLYTLFLSNGKYSKPWGMTIFVLLLIALLYVAFYPNNIFKQYGGTVTKIVLVFLGLKTFLFGLMLFLPRARSFFRNILYFIAIFLYVVAIIFNAVSEYFFWNEFGVRYNFIAVDYLIYTNEVIGNIMESYPVLPLFSVIFVASLGITIYIYVKTKDNLIKLPSFGQKILLLFIYAVLAVGCIFLIPSMESMKKENNFAEEIQANGVYKFYYAFTHSELDYFKFYPTIAQNKAEKIYLSQFVPPTFPRKIVNDSAEIHKNVVLISVESLSAEFMSHYGNKDNITPFLDSLANHSLLFTNLYATGNRTVRGLEALTLNIPPTAGESIVKREDNKNKFTTGSLFKSRGYSVKFLYGGYSYFDNMADFYKGNGYGIVDRDNFSPDEISFANVWGVADEDMAKKAIEVMNEQAKEGKPFFNQWMTVSNHRPFTYPDGRIDIPGTAKSRDGGVKYTDYSLKLFFQMAKKQSWYNNTVFVIVADHCASSAGKTELPMDKYRIPGIVFSPNDFIKSQNFDRLMSQIDIMPTVFGLLNFSYTSKFLGQDVLKPNYIPRAYIATYQDLGYVKDNFLTIISPIRKVKQYKLQQRESDLPAKFNIFYDEIPQEKLNQKLVDETIATYETVSRWLQQKKLDK